MRLIKILFLVIVAAALVILAVANRHEVTVNLLPVDPASLGLEITQSVTLPVFTALFGALFLGIVIGLVLEALRESYHRRNEREYKRKAMVLDREVHRLAKKAGEEDDDILGVKRA